MFHCMQHEYKNDKLVLFGYMCENEEALINLSDLIGDYIECFGGFDHEEFDIQVGDTMIASVNLFPDSQSMPDFVRCRVLEVMESKTEYRVNLVDYGLETTVMRLWPDRKSHTGAGFEYCGLILEYKIKITPNDYAWFSKELETHDYKIGIRIEEKLDKAYRICFDGQIVDFESSIDDSCTEDSSNRESNIEIARKLINLLKKQEAKIPERNVDLICDNLTECINIVLK